jgi:hypothetical protein
MQVKDLPPAIREACIERGHGDDASITPIQAMEEYGAWEIGNGPFVRHLIEAYIQLVTLDTEQKAEARKAKIAEQIEQRTRKHYERINRQNSKAYPAAIAERRVESIDDYRDLHMQQWIDPAIQNPLTGESTMQLSRRPIPEIETSSTDQGHSNEPAWKLK